MPRRTRRKTPPFLNSEPVERPKPPKLRKWAFFGLVLIITGVSVGVMKSNHNIPIVHLTGDNPSKIIISTNSSNPSHADTSSPSTPTVTLVHGKASSTSFVAQTIEFEGPIVAYVAINYDSFSADYQTYSVYLPAGSYGVQMWQNSIPSDTRPECNVRNGILDPFIVTGQAEQVQDFTCT